MTDSRPGSAGRTHAPPGNRSGGLQIDEAARMVLSLLSPASARATNEFLHRRALAQVQKLPEGFEAALMDRILAGLSSGMGEGLSIPDLLLEWAGFLETRGRLSAAAVVLRTGSEVRPHDSEFLLHRARVARKAGHIDEARRLYRRIQERGDGPGRLHRMARVGSALLSEDPEPALGRALRMALRDGDREAAAVALEERARLRRRRSQTAAALRDYGAALLRFPDPVDKGRVGLELADVLLARNELNAARQVLLEVERLGHPDQAVLARGRLFCVSLALGDALGLRRWRHAHAPALVGLTPAGRSGPTKSRSRAGRWVGRFRRLSADGG